MCPAYNATGGPELLHQLAFKLKKKGINSKMYYTGDYQTTPIHPNYEKYTIDYDFTIVDNEENVLIVPEADTDALRSFKNLRKVIWWLSVDNYFRSIRGVDRMLRSWGLRKRTVLSSAIIKEFKKYRHLSQSHYAQVFLLKYGIKSFYLSDYLRESFFYSAEDIVREDIVLYNPKKGLSFTRLLMEYYKNIKWIPIENMTPEQVGEILSRAKVYVDFGEHPGKDRFPREAAIKGCCIITGKRGAAYYEEDLPIPLKYKFADVSENIPIIIDQIKDCLKNYPARATDFEDYKKWIKRDESKFEKDIACIFVNKEHNNI